MIQTNFYNYFTIGMLISFVTLNILTSCENSLDQPVYNKISSSQFYRNAKDAKAAVTASYGALGRFWAGTPSETVVQSGFMSGHLIPSRTFSSNEYQRMTMLDLSADMGNLLVPYNKVMPKITSIAIKIEKISNIAGMDEDLKDRYIAELRGLRAIYSQRLYDFYGPIPTRLDPQKAADPSAKPIPRPKNEEMLNQIEKDYKNAAVALPKRFTGNDYGRITSTACYTGLMKLYMKERNWTKAIEIGNKIQRLGYSLVDDYDDNFTLANRGGNSEIILAIPTRIIADPSTSSNPNENAWQMLALPANYKEPLNADFNINPAVNQWEWYKFPWELYDKFDPKDKRTKRLLAKYIDLDGEIFDARANGYKGAAPLKYGIDPQSTGESNRVNIIIWRYADVLLLQAEAINEKYGPTDEAYSLINTVRKRAGLKGLAKGLNRKQFRKKIMNERLFELWDEGTARDDMIRWGTLVQRAIDDGSKFATKNDTLLPIPRQVITESGGVVKQNPGY